MYGGFASEHDYFGWRMALADQSTPPPTPPKPPSIKQLPLMAAESPSSPTAGPREDRGGKLHHMSTPDQERGVFPPASPQLGMAARLNQPLPPLPPINTATAALSNLAVPTPAVQRNLRPPVALSPATPTRTLSSPGVVRSPPQLTLAIPEEIDEEKRASTGMDPLYRQQPASSPAVERDSANSRFSYIKRASTSPSVVRRSSRHANPEMPPDSVPVDEETLRYTEEIRKKRESKRRWKEAEDEDRVIMGNKVDANHPNYVTAYNMLTGLRVAVSRVSAKIDRPLTDEDFTFCQKFTFDYKGNELSPASKHDFRFKDYSPWVFRHLRALFHLDPADYLISLTSRILLSELGSPGKSGSFFYFSRDYRFVIKTLHHAEHRYLRKILRLYYEHVKANPNTLISQFYGLHRVKSRGRKSYLVVINNVFPASKDIHQTFDLKGSTVGREFDEEKLKENPRRPLKDLNWIRRDMHLEFGPRKKELLMTQLKKDVELLSSLNVMDYSLLLGIHYVSRGNAENIRETTLSVYQPRAGLTRSLSRTLSKRKAYEALLNTEPRRLSSTGAGMVLPTEEFLERKRGLFTSEQGGFYATNEQDQPTGDIIYYFGVIDLLTTYGFKKHVETFFKSFSHPRDQLSPIPPLDYAARFVKFIRANIKTKEQVAREKAKQENALKERETTEEPSPLSTIEEQEDRRTLERAREQTRKESVGGKEEKDVGRRTTLSPSDERPEQVIPNVTVQLSSQRRSQDDSITPLDFEGTVLGRKDMVESPIEEEKYLVVAEASFVREKTI